MEKRDKYILKSGLSALVTFVIMCLIIFSLFLKGNGLLGILLVVITMGFCFEMDEYCKED